MAWATPLFIVLWVGMLGVVVGRVAGWTARWVKIVRSSANQAIKYFRKQFMTAGEDSCGRQEPAADESRGSMGLRFIFSWLWASLGILVIILTLRDVLPCHPDSLSPPASLLAVLLSIASLMPLHRACLPFRKKMRIISILKGGTSCVRLLS